jgi:pimeloyl-ACP methyl ester carboxylesterase
VFQAAGLSYRALGAGAPVVLLHPGPGLDGSVFLPGVEQLSDAGYRVLLVDLPGSGHSPDGEWTLVGQAAAVQRFAEALELHDWTLLGHSFGGYVALQHLVDHGSAARLIASCTDADEEEAPGVPEDRFAGLPDDVSVSVSAAFDREKTVATPEECRQVWLDQLPFFSTQDISAMLRDVHFRPEAHHARDWGDLHALDALASADIPVLAIAAEDDRPQPPANAERIAAAAKHGRLLRLPGGHFPFAEDPARYWSAIADWLSTSR